ncbi:MAG TPA: hypothetical protein VHO48_00165 [Anaerolineaceae bacterium]|jgi:hypothetical protein|nr:hypothetical protein [Anaerolineaceae bacterium]
MGLAISAFLFPVFNQTLWIDWDPAPVLANARQLGLMVLLVVGIDILILLEIPVVLYPLALASAVGVLLVLSLVYTMVCVMLFKQENRFQSLRQIAVPCLGGLTLALLQIAVLDLARFWLTGTWQGFTL